MRIIVTIVIGIMMPALVHGQAWVQMLNDTNYRFEEVRKSFEGYVESMDKAERIPGRKQFDRYSYFIHSRLASNGRYGRQAGIWEEYQRLKKEKMEGKYSQSANWEPVGPFVLPQNSPGMGRINTMAYHPTQTNIMYAGAASGGVWKTTSGGAYWHPVSDDIASMGISSIVINHQNPDIIYAATGDFNHSDTYSIGVIKSTDGGNTWNTTGLNWAVLNQRRIAKLVMHPNNPEILLAATTNGVFKTIDGGVNWLNVRSGPASDIVLRPDNPDVVYAVVANKFWKSENGGDSFSLMPISFTSTIGRAKIAVTPADPDYIYMVTIKNDDSGFEGLYRSTDGGNTFTKRSSSPNILGYATDGSSPGGIAWYCLGLAVSPTNKEDVWVASVNVWRSTNGGLTWKIKAHWYGDQGLPYVHADIHDMSYHPVTKALYICSDGGIDITTNHGSSYQKKNSGLMIGQVYRIGLSKQDLYRIIGGWQDNGTHFMSGSTWSHMLGGDGMECIISHTNPSYMYGEMQYGSIYRTYDSGNNWMKISDPINEEGYWLTPLVMHPTQHSTLLAGYDNIWRSNNYGTSWTKISNFTGTGYYDKFRSVVYAPSNPSTIYAATYNCIFKTTNGGTVWTQVNNNLPNSPISYIAVHPTNPSIVYVTMSGFNDGKKVFKSVNGGIAWSNFSGTLPNLPTNCIALENNSNEGMYVGMDVGVFYRDNTLTDWIPFFDGLPNVKVAELEIHHAAHKLVAATYGRGIWWSDTYSWLNSVNELSPGKAAGFNLYPNPSNGDFRLTMNEPQSTIRQASLYNATGALIRTITSLSGASHLDIRASGELTPGICFLVVECNDGRTTSGKVVISR